MSKHNGCYVCKSTEQEILKSGIDRQQPTQFIAVCDRKECVERVRLVGGSDG